MEFRHRAIKYRNVARYLLDHDVTPAGFLGRLGLPPELMLDTDAWLDRDLCFRLAATLARYLGDDHCGFHISEINSLGDHGAWGQHVRNSRTLREAIDRSIRELGRLETGTRLTLMCDGNLARYQISFAGHSDSSARQFHEAYLLTMRTILDLVVEYVPAEARFTHRVPIGDDSLERLFGPALRFGAEVTELVFERGALDLALGAPDPGQSAQSGLPPATPAETAAAVHRVLRELIEFGRPTLAAAAEALSLNVRTLQRRLSEWGTTFEAILEEYRQRKAVEYLRDRTLSVTDIAFLLGYSDAAHFTRAFRRWTGECPSRFVGTKARAEPRFSGSGDLA